MKASSGRRDLLAHMLFLDLSLPTAAENLALDEALLDSVDEQPSAPELLRLWECPQYAAVLGRSGKVAEEVNLPACDAAGVPVLRRSSGGGTVLVGPGCLMYSLRLSYEQRPYLRELDRAHLAVLATNAVALNRLLPELHCEPQGTSDLASTASAQDQSRRKFSGNSLRCKRNFLLYHGTLLYDFDLPLIERLLKPPPRQPDYRQERTHGEFVMNLPGDAAALRTAISEAWKANELLEHWPKELTAELLQQRYLRDEWNRER
jgi:lipoate-protein ligase A